MRSEHRDNTRLTLRLDRDSGNSNSVGSHFALGAASIFVLDGEPSGPLLRNVDSCRVPGTYDLVDALAREINNVRDDPYDQTSKTYL